MRTGNEEANGGAHKSPSRCWGQSVRALGPAPIRPEAPVAIDPGTAVFVKSLRLRSISGPDYALWAGNADIADRESGPPAVSLFTI
jgi:hypothetical protein